MVQDERAYVRHLLVSAGALQGSPPSPNTFRETKPASSAEAKIRNVLDRLRGEDSIAELCHKESIAESLYGTWSKWFMEACRSRLAGDTARAATTGKLQELRRPERLVFGFTWQALNGRIRGAKRPRSRQELG